MKAVLISGLKSDVTIRAPLKNAAKYLSHPLARCSPHLGAAYANFGHLYENPLTQGLPRRLLSKETLIGGT